MSVPRLDPLFHRPGPMRVAPQKFSSWLVSITSVCTCRSRSTIIFVANEVGDKPSPLRSGIKREATGIDRVVRHRKSLDKDVANLEFGAGAKDSPSSDVDPTRRRTHCFGGLRVRINRPTSNLRTEHLQSANVDRHAHA